MASEVFDAAWLALREPVDHRARSETLLPPLRRAWQARSWSRILDLGAGTGSNLRYLAPRLDGDQAWTLVDRDARLLALAAAPGVAVARRVTGDLGREGLALVRQADLVTASALLDLVSEDWLRRLVNACCAAGAGVLLAMTYDGRIAWADAEPDTALIERLVNAHQRRDKGLGPALGPAAAPAAEHLLREAGYHVAVRASPWELASSESRLVEALVAGWERAATGCARDTTEADRVRAWAASRRRIIDGGSFTLTVGHLDLLALPPDSRS
jgi:SAM-dependent methyltransferase